MEKETDYILVRKMYHYIDEELSVKGYDLDGMRIEFEKQLETLKLKNKKNEKSNEN